MPCSIATLLYKHFPFCQVLLEANFNFADTVIALARCRDCGGNRKKRAGNARPYDMDFSSDMVLRNGMGKPIPYNSAAQRRSAMQNRFTPLFRIGQPQ